MRRAFQKLYLFLAFEQVLGIVKNKFTSTSSKFAGEPLWQCYQMMQFVKFNYELYRQIIMQGFPEASAVGVFASYLSLKRRLLLLDKTTENDSYISVRISSIA